MIPSGSSERREDGNPDRTHSSKARHPCPGPLSQSEAHSGGAAGGPAFHLSPFTFHLSPFTFSPRSRSGTAAKRYSREAVQPRSDTAQRLNRTETAPGTHNPSS